MIHTEPPSSEPGARGARVDRRLAAAAVVYAVAAVHGAWVALREDVVGEPLGVRLPGRVATHLAIGWGSGTSAPWPMPAAALASALRAGPGAGTACVVLGVATVCGQLVEPVAWGRRPSSPAVRRAIALDLAAGAALALAGRRAAGR